MLCFYATCLLFVFVVLGFVARLHGFSIFKLVRELREELLIVLGTSSSESVLPRLIDKLELVLQELNATAAAVRARSGSGFIIVAGMDG